jgi:hypothetical protein
MTGNGLYGWYLWTDTPSTAVVTLKGVYAYGNPVNGYLDGAASLLVYRTCP